MLLAACGDDGAATVSTKTTPDDGPTAGTGDTTLAPVRRCDSVEVDGDVVIEHEKDFTARFRVGESYTRTVMLFGGESVDKDNVFSNAYIFGLDKEDAQMLAQKYPDFYLCSSPGGAEASMYIVPYDLVPVTCDIYDQIVAALDQYYENVTKGGDRTSLRLEGAPLELESVTADANGADYTDMVTGQDFHLITGVEQLTGESVVEFGTTN